ncbi:MAG: DNA-3-methyladenine glycosylase [Vicinamibacterales bacterium]
MSAGRRRGRPLPRTFYDRATLAVARDLVGKLLVRRSDDGVAAGMIVETEAYIGETDPACHAASGPTRRNAPLYGDPGLAYVYFTYGMHCLFNAVAERRGFPAAVLVRALEPVDGEALMRRRRGRPSLAAHDLCRGPGNLARALGITLADNRADLTHAPASGAGLWIEDRGIEIADVEWSPRIGIRIGTEHAWRCFAAGNRSVSGRRTGF